ncbi:hypothetical protein [Desulfonatronovibrio magnus]|uniref:hypothetical protein n=1 Tax=Desulfonatronovibrio magnus TaxID=698827 RepID=UPI00069777E9|nr:hypothetical protein [Desulfonatronovibrio magnus]
MSRNYCISIINPQGFGHARAFQEMALTLYHAFKGLGCSVKIDENSILDGGTTIILGAFLLSPAQSRSLPKSCIVYNLEPLDRDSHTLGQHTYEMMGRLTTWDYSLRNIARLEKLFPGGDFRHAPVGYMPQLTCIPKSSDLDIDVLFYGSVNPRRASILNALKQAGLKVASVFGVYGQDRDNLISRSKVVLNMHFYSASILEMVRVSYLLANKKAVVAECNPQTEIEPDIRQAVAAVPYEQLVQTCQMLVKDNTRRSELEQNGFEIMSARDEQEILRGLVEDIQNDQEKRQGLSFKLGKN